MPVGLRDIRQPAVAQQLPPQVHQPAADQDRLGEDGDETEDQGEHRGDQLECCQHEPAHRERAEQTRGSHRLDLSPQAEPPTGPAAGRGNARAQEQSRPVPVQPDQRRTRRDTRRHRSEAEPHHERRAGPRVPQGRGDTREAGTDQGRGQHGHRSSDERVQQQPPQIAGGRRVPGDLPGTALAPGRTARGVQTPAVPVQPAFPGAGLRGVGKVRTGDLHPRPGGRQPAAQYGQPADAENRPHRAGQEGHSHRYDEQQTGRAERGQRHPTHRGETQGAPPRSAVRPCPVAHHTSRQLD